MSQSLTTATDVIGKPAYVLCACGRERVSVLSSPDPDRNLIYTHFSIQNISLQTQKSSTIQSKNEQHFNSIHSTQEKTIDMKLSMVIN